jgi:predicted dienelactone hydrolase
MMPPVKRRRFVVPAIAFAILALAACGKGASSQPSDSKLLESAGQRGTYGVGVTTIDLVDTSRGTTANGDARASNDRKLPIEVWYPIGASTQPEMRDAPLDKNDAPYPLIIFAHGLSGNRRQSVSFTQHLASHGYIVAAPDFPLSHLGTPGGPRLGDVLEQPKDVSFVIDQLLVFNGQEGHLLNRAIDGKKIGMSGHSLGAMTTLLDIYGPNRDARISAALPFSTPGCFFPDGFGGNVSVPMMAVGGTNDLITPPSSADRAYTVAHAPRYLFHIKGGDHVRFADVNLSDGELNAIGGLQSLFGSTFVADAIEVAGKLGGNAGSCVASNQAVDPPITADQQRQLMRTLAVPFFDGYLRGAKASRVLLTKLPGLLPGVTLQSNL